MKMAIVSHTTEELRKMESETDQERILAMTDDDITIDEDCPDTVALLASGRGKISRRGRPPVSEPKEKVTLRIEASVLRALRATGKGWQTRLSNQISEWTLSAK
jgi:uncharacterized protein (DUF4415 family)